ncbi:MAG: sulfate/molybdate ABC transporter ATP-binding protein [Acidimicrobiia bacterium]
MSATTSAESADHGARGLDASLRLRRGPLDIAVDLSMAPGETVAVLGPNGAGKSTLLSVIAGLVAIESGHVIVDGDAWDGGARGARRAEDRSVGMVFQDYLLFPHLTVIDNVAYGLRRRGVGRGPARQQALTWLERVGLGSLPSRRPGELSGGQQQRVALARALAPEPRVLLLDEPLAALDVTTRSDTRRDLRDHLDAFEGMVVLVTHDPLDAITLADRIVIVEDGHVVQEGTAAEVTSRPRSAFAADIAGLNLFRGHAAAGAIEVSDGLRLVTSGGSDGAVLAVFHPRAVNLHAERPQASARNVWLASIDTVDLRGGLARLSLRVGDRLVVAEITLAAYQELQLAEGAAVWASLKATEIDVYPA